MFLSKQEENITEYKMLASPFACSEILGDLSPRASRCGKWAGGLVGPACQGALGW